MIFNEYSNKNKKYENLDYILILLINLENKLIQFENLENIDIHKLKNSIKELENLKIQLEKNDI